jgi:hypothetical protein
VPKTSLKLARPDDLIEILCGIRSTVKEELRLDELSRQGEAMSAVD